MAEILRHPWFAGTDRLAYLEKRVAPPYSFLSLADLRFNCDAIDCNDQLVSEALRAQADPTLFSPLLPNFAYCARASPPGQTGRGLKRKSRAVNCASVRRLRQVDNFV